MSQAARRRRSDRARVGVAVEPGGERAVASSPAPAPARDRRTWLVVAPLVLLVVAAFLPVLGNDFVEWDDQANILSNRRYRGLGWPQVRWAWTTFLLGVYQPVAWLLLEAQYVIWGLEAKGYHLVSLV